MLERFWNGRTIGFLSSLLIHALLFLGSAVAFVRPVQYGIQGGSGGIEVSLIAALPQASEDSNSQVSPDKKSFPVKKEDGFVAEEFEKKPPEKTAQKNLQAAVGLQKNNKTGDGSSPAPGEDVTTFYSPGGAFSRATGRHLKNPAPAYPEQARRLKQEGLVLLAAWVDKTGRPSKVEVKSSSGFPLLDRSALQTVRRWKFQPAALGMLARDSEVEIPIRFRLED